MTEALLLIIVIGLNDALMFLIGAKVGQKVVRGQEVELPKFEVKNPITEYQESKEAKKEQEKLRIISDNIDAYDGTGIGQKNIPN